MKKLLKQVVGLLGICFLTSFYFACHNGFQNLWQAGEEGKAAVSIVITETRARTVFPDVSDIAAYKLFGSYGGGEETELAELTGETTVFLEPGTWNFTLNAYNNTGDLILQGTVQNQVINLTGANEVNFSLSAFNSGAGDVEIIINFPDSAGITRITASGNIGPEEFPVNNGDEEFIYAKTGIDAGDYFISFKLYREDELKAVVSEVVLVRGNLTSAKTITLVGYDLKPETHTVTFDSQGGSTVDPITGVIPGNTINRPADPTKAGYAFGGWYTEENCSNLWNFNTDTVTSNVILYASWNPQYTVTFDSQDGSDVNPITVGSGNTINKPADPTRAGYAFSGWYTEEDCTNLWDFDTDTVTEDITLYAKWLAPHTVTFNADNGEPAPAQQIIGYGGTITEPASMTKVGYIFDAWYKEATFVTVWNFATDTVTGDTTLYAKWLAAYTVTFNADGGEPAPDQQTVTYGSTITEPAAMTKTGHIFNAWYKEATFVTVWNFTTDTVTEDTTLYAKWTPNQYTVTFNSNGGTAVSPITGVNHGSTITSPGNPTSGYGTFENWYSDTGRTALFDFDTPITANTTLYAKWTAAYNLGGIGPGGGKVFYRSETGFTMTDNNEVCYYLEAAPNDAGELTWAPGTTRDTSITGTSEAIGAGRKNTALILAWYSQAPAAMACNTYSNNGKTDWFLPSSEELRQLYNNWTYADNLEVSWLNSYYYWSSYTMGTQTVGDVWHHRVTCIGFRMGDADMLRGNYEFYVRPIRAF